MATGLTPAQEDYLQIIHRLSVSGPVRVSDLATEMHVRRPTASRAVKELASSGLVQHQPYGRIELTAEGRLAGESIDRRDHSLARLLVDLLAMDAAEADPAVHRLRHFISHDVMWRLEVLVRFALSSDAWVKRLHHRLRTEQPLTEITGTDRADDVTSHR